MHAVSTFLVVTGCNILDSQQYRDPDSTTFFMRVHVAADRTVDTAQPVPSQDDRQLCRPTGPVASVPTHAAPGSGV